MRRFAGTLLLFTLGCTSSSGDESGLLSAGEDPGTEGDTGAGDGDGDGDGDGESSGDGDGDGDGEDPPLLDVGAPGDGDGDMCKVGGDLDGVGTCDEQAPPDSFEPSLEWSFDVDPETQFPLQSMVIPLVGNFTDDNDDGEIDLCDTPDVLLVANLFVQYNGACSLYLLDGATGQLHWKIPESEGVSCTSTPAFADIDDDGLPEIVTTYQDGSVWHLKAFEHDGSVAWTDHSGGEDENQIMRQGGSIAIHDLDADGDAEIVFNHEVHDHTGKLSWVHATPVDAEGQATTAADLDGDGDLEVITGHAAYHHDGTTYWDIHPQVSGRSFPQVADLDEDGRPEVLLTNEEGIVMVEHDGAIKWGPVQPTGVVPLDVYTWTRPATVHDFDGDGLPEWASSAEEVYALYEGPDPSDVVWEADVADPSGAAAGSAFDFLGDGVAEAMYADEWQLGVYDGQDGSQLLSTDRCSGTMVEYPVVADVDNDGSAEILVVSTICANNAPAKPALQVFGEAQGRWIQARRIWNQHTYHVTNVREDSTLPQQPVDNWEHFNTFRTNAQIQPGGGLCVPEG